MFKDLYVIKLPLITLFDRLSQYTVCHYLNHFMTLTSGHRRNHQEVDACRTMPLPEESDVVRIPAEFRYVLLDPMEGCHLVHQAVIAPCCAIEGRQETCINKQT